MATFFSTSKFCWALGRFNVPIASIFAARLFQNSLAIQFRSTGLFPTNGNNTLFDLGLFLFVGGYVEDNRYSEDTYLGVAMQVACCDNEKAFKYVGKKGAQITLPARRFLDAFSRGTLPYCSMPEDQFLQEGLCSNWKTSDEFHRSTEKIFAATEASWKTVRSDALAIVSSALRYTDIAAYNHLIRHEETATKVRSVVRETFPRAAAKPQSVINPLEPSVSKWIKEGLKSPVALYWPDLADYKPSPDARYAFQDKVMSQVLKGIEANEDELSIGLNKKPYYRKLSFEVSGLGEKTIQNLHADDIRVVAASILYEDVQNIIGGDPLLWNVGDFLSYKPYNPDQEIIKFTLRKTPDTTTAHFELGDASLSNLEQRMIHISSGQKPLLLFFNAPSSGLFHGATEVSCGAKNSTRKLRYSAIAIR